MVSGFRFPGLRVARQQAGAPRPNKKKEKRMNMNRPTIAKQTKARIQPKPNKQTAKSAESIYALKRKNKRLIADFQSKYQNTERYCTQGDNVVLSTQFHNVIVVPTIEYRRSKNKVVHTTQDINVSIKSTLFENNPAPILHTLAGAIDR